MGRRRGRLGMGLMFYPRGGSAQVARYLGRALVEAGWDVVLASGSLGSPGDETHAPTFYEGLHVEVADYTPALERFRSGEDQLAGPVPFHGSFEDRDGAPDPVFAALSAEQAEAQVSAWEGVFERAGFGRVDVLHLHHLTPMHDAAARRFPERPLVTHLHGTELKMLDRIDRLDAVALALDTSLDQLAVAGDAGSLLSDCRLAGADRVLLRQTKSEPVPIREGLGPRASGHLPGQVSASPVSPPPWHPRRFVSWASRTT